MARAPHPATIGRYEIVGHLATGGMAEVFLGRLRGPHGFERPVVIKRILPHLVSDPEIVDMFLDEARIIASLRHPNLIHVHELGRDGDELFMAMEFLEGESVAGLCRRLALLREDMDPALAAHVLAEACAGLHAAHEAVGPDERPLELIHRDVSPQNLFVTYAGAVHVIDFGIARTATKTTRTETGMIRGKLEYLAPEQLRGEEVDRRLDLFALGVVLFELTTGRRLYRRKSHAEVMMSILEEPVPSLRAVRPDVPAELDEICSRALAKDAKDRYQSAAEMRRALLAFVRRSAGDDDFDDRLAKLMQRMFSVRSLEKAEFVKRLSDGALPVAVALPPAEVDVMIELPSATAHAAMLAKSRTAPRGSRRARVTWLVVVAAAALLLTRLGMFVSARSQRSAVTTAAAVTAPPAAPMVLSPSGVPAADAPSSATSPPVNDDAPPAPSAPRLSGAPNAAAPRKAHAPPARSTRPTPSMW